MGEAIDRMAEDIEKQKEKREKFSRRRRHNADSDIDYINERNMKFNQKCERFYGALLRISRITWRGGPQCRDSLMITLQYRIVPYNIVLYSTVLYRTIYIVVYSTELYRTI